MDSSPFMRLAPEIRNQIFQQVLCLRDPIAIPATRELHTTALLLTCEHIYQEYGQMYYANNTFVVTGQNAHDDFLIWFRALGKRHTTSLRNVIVEVWGSAGFFGQDASYASEAIRKLAKAVNENAHCRLIIRLRYLELGKMIELDVGCLRESLVGGMNEVKEKMKEEEDQDVYEKLFWAKRHLGQLLVLEEARCEGGTFEA